MLVSGHRGAAGLCPENTLKGIERALDLGVDFVEIDVHRTRDDVVVVMHDETLDRTTNGSGPIREHTLEEIQKLDAGEGERVPTLCEVLDLVKGRAHLLCEIKTGGSAEGSAACVHDAGMAKEMTFISFNLDVLRYLRRTEPGIDIGVLLWHPNESDVAVAGIIGATWIDLYYRRLTLHLADLIKGAGMKLRTYTPNEAHEFKVMAAMGVDAITTDRPDRLIDWQRQRAMADSR